MSKAGGKIILPTPKVWSSSKKVTSEKTEDKKVVAKKEEKTDVKSEGKKADVKAKPAKKVEEKK